MGGMLQNGGAGGLSQGLNQGMGMGMQYRQMRDSKEDRELKKELLDYQMKEQKLQLDKMKLEMDKAKKLEHAEQIFMDKFGSYPDGGSLPVQGPPPPAQGQSAQWPPPDVQQPQQNIMQLIKLAMAAGKMPELETGMQAGIIETPRNQMELAAKMAELRQKAVEMERDKQRFAWEGNKEKRAEAGEAREDIKLGLSKQDRAQAQKKFELDYNKAQLAMKEEGYRKSLGLKFLSEGTPESIAAGQAVLGGDFAGGIKLRYPDVSGLTDNQLIARVQKGDKDAAEMLQYKRDLKDNTGIEMVTHADGTSEMRIGGSKSKPAIYPARDFQKDQVEGAQIDQTMGGVSELIGLVQANPTMIGWGGATAQLDANLKAWGNRILGKEVKYSDNATAAQQIKTLESEVMRNIAGTLSGSLSDKEMAFIKESIGGSSGFFSTTTAEQKLAALGTIKATLEQAKARIAARQQNFEQNAPRPPARKSALDAKIESLVGTPETPPDPATIQQRIESMTPEQKQQRMQELMQKQGGG